MEDSLLMTTSDFFNAIGGSLGLFLGFSAISVLDKIIDFMKKFAK